MNVADRKAAGNLGLRFEGRRGLLDQDMVERLVEAVILRLHAPPGDTKGQRRRVEN